MSNATMCWSKFCSQEFWRNLFDVNVRSEESENQTPVRENLIHVGEIWRYITIFIQLIDTNQWLSGLV